MTVLVKHDAGCPLVGFGHSEAAKRIYDTYHLHRSADIHGAIGNWFAAALADGTTDNILYPSKSAAIIHQHHNEMYYTYIQITPANMSICSAEAMLTVARKLYDAGFRITDPDDMRREPIKRITREDQNAFAYKGLATNLKWFKTLEEFLKGE
jgi:hypothetical protein